MPTRPKKQERPIKPEWQAMGVRIRKLLIEQHKLDMDLAQALGLKKSSLSPILNGRRAPKVEQLRAIANYLGVKPEEILGEDPKPTPQKPAPASDTLGAATAQQVFIDYVAKHKDSLTENEIKGLLDGSYQLDDVVPDEQAITDFLRAKRALLERLRRRPSGS